MELKPGYKQTEVGVIPEDWDVCSLNDLSTMKSGISITSANIDQYSKFPCYGGNGLRGYTTQYTHDGAYALIGRQGALCGNVLRVDGQFFASEHAIVVTPLQRTDINWLTFVLGVMHLNRYSESSAQPGLSVSKIQKLTVATPPIKAEQTAIASALSDADALIQSLARLIAKKRQIKQGAMQTLLNPYENGRLKAGWEVKKLGDVADIRSGGTPSTRIAEFWNGEILWCTPTDITALRGKKYLYSTSRKITSKGLAVSSAEIIPENSIVMTSRATIGECAINKLPVSTNQGFKNFVPYKDIDIEFLYYQLLTQKREFIGLCSGSTFLEISKNQLFNFEIPLPRDVSEQTRIATILSNMDAEIAALEAKLAKYRHIKQGMMQNLLTGRIRLI